MPPKRSENRRSDAEAWELVRKHKKLVYRVSNRWTTATLEEDDRITAGTLGLYRAAQIAVITDGREWAGYACQWINQAIELEVAGTDPNGVHHEMRLHLRRWYRLREPGDVPDVPTIMLRLGCDASLADKIKKAEAAYETKRGEEAEIAFERQVSREPDPYREAERKDLFRALMARANLTPAERVVVGLMHGCGWAYPAIGKRIGTTTDMAWRIGRAAEVKLKAAARQLAVA